MSDPTKAEIAESRRHRWAAFDTQLSRVRAALAQMRRPQVATALALALLLALAAVARDIRSRQGLPYLHHWDEPFLVNRALQILRTGDYNPRFFNYGSLLVYADAAAAIPTYLTLAKRPDGAPDALRQPADIQFRGAREDALTTSPEAQPYWVSHPAFYRAARRVNVVFGTLAVLLSYLLGRALGGRVAGLAAAFVLATNGFHIEHSAWATTDVPAATFALAALWGALRFIDGGGPRMLLLASAAVGLAVSTKYNSALFALIPGAALSIAWLRRLPGYRPWLWLGAPAVAGGSFLATTPYALLDLPTFLRDTGRMLFAYLGIQDPILWVEPGWPHFAFDLALLARQLGPIVAVGAVGGMVVALARVRGWLVLPIGLLVLAATSQTGAPFHRNVIVCYPLAAVAFGIALAVTLRAGPYLLARRGVAALLVLGAFASAAQGLASAALHGRAPDTRSQLVDRLEKLDAFHEGEHLAIAAELNLHALDLVRLSVRHTVRPLREILCAPHGETAIVVPSRPRATFRASGSEKTEFERLIASAGPVLLAIDADRAFSLDAPVIQPGLWVRRLTVGEAPPVMCAAGRTGLEELAIEGESERNPRSLGIAPGGLARTPTYRFEQGRALVSIRVAAAQPGFRTTCEVLARSGASSSDPPLFRWRIEPRRSPHVEEIQLPLAVATPLFFELRVPAESPGGALLYGIWLDAEPLDAPAPG